ncbi:MAG: BlaI/MecI/CopY family transcriptional regulator [Lachnospiraceae bacterium]|nr:BlaI/MecI/CopY family transcriptional regulator [Lachnospiraceae bacterium]MBO6300467.1 BlaI/MecI/CopY family transcriptional regulator [Lachnospiraceae bacterium]MBP3297217.1 BlaI/MecI/CopY family transcriptional regulator [Lachnospiraceae bacterium]
MDILAEKEAKFANIIWVNAPVKPGKLAKICEPLLCWKRTTTYTVLKKLCDKGFFKVDEDGMVKTVVSRERYREMLSDKIIEEYFNGSLSAFVKAYTQKREIPPLEAVEIYKYIEISRILERG